MNIYFGQARGFVFLLSILGCFLGSRPVEASELKLGGDLTTKYECTDYGEILPSSNLRKNTYTINGAWKPEENTEAYIRFAWQEYGGDQDLPAEFRVDKYGLRIKQNDMQWTLGTQNLFLGAFGGLLDLEDKAGDRLFNGIELASRHGAVQMRLQSGRLGGALFADERSREMTTLQLSGKVHNTKWSVTDLHIPDLDPADRFVDLSFEHAVGKMTYMAELIRSNGESEAVARAAGFFYCFDDRNALGLMVGESGRSSVPQGAELLGASDNGIRGMRLKTYHLTKGGLFVLEYTKVHSTIFDMDISKTTLSYKIAF